MSCVIQIGSKTYSHLHATIEKYGDLLKMVRIPQLPALFLVCFHVELIWLL